MKINFSAWCFCDVCRWAAVQERAVFKWFSDGRHLHCRASKDCPGIVQVGTSWFTA